MGSLAAVPPIKPSASDFMAPDIYLGHAVVLKKLCS